ncbi:GTPase/DUF3482 domain-containing protein [Luteolibacter pohnpeiensis]|uniref:GTPase/DUF3482 domain-containing protein n=1 Tax=Luteolibacter pohnpeiensis TaxID=454153 RepID=A0A934S4R4_9BACT|nr:DUF3482 domain-containing protein [Luteolibacter pohnpeiensis]MBK1882521.1 GTPase/DUF3482 domain-containing protein [Luteolibacter pohnpeiensis]
MSEWVQQDVPAFAVVGRVNMGKSSVLATLLEIDDNQLIRVSATPGETTNCQTHRVVFSDRDCIRFIDTPGFSRPVEAMREIQRLHGEGTPGVEALKEFVAKVGEEFGDEKRLLEPLLEGAGVLYVVDPAKPLRDDFLAEMEILRWTGVPRLALLNRRAANAGTDEEAWRKRLGGAFNLVRTFDAHQARYEERLRLLKALLEIEERHRGRLEETIALVEEEWDRRREEAVEVIIGFLEESLSLKVTATLEERDLTLPSRRHRKEELLQQEYFGDLAKLERKCFEKLLKIHRHHLLKADSSAESFQGIDLESAETWTKWGLGRGQLSVAAALAGGAAGLAVDVATGGLSHGAGTIFGALGGGAAAWLKGGSLPDLRIDLRGGVKLGTGEGKALSMGPPKNPNFPWILLDGVLTRYQRIVNRSHGRRDEEVLKGQEAGFTRDFPADRRSVLAKWFGGCLKGSPNRALEPEIFEALLETLQEVAEEK